MRLSLKTKQVAGVTLIVGLTVTGASLLLLASIARFSLEESAIRGDFLARMVFQQAGRVAPSGDLRAALRADPGVRAMLEASIAYVPNVTYAVIVDRSGKAIAHSTPALEDQAVPPQALVRTLLAENLIQQFEAIYSDRTFEVSEPLLTATGEQFGAIRVGLSMLLVRQEIRKALWPVLITTVTAVILTLLVATAFAQWLLRPIAILRTGLARLGRGETSVKLELPPDEEFGDLGQSFETVSATLAAARSQLAGQSASLESVVDRLEDAVAVFGPRGELLFANPPMRASIGAGEDGELARALPPSHPFGHALARALEERRTTGPHSIVLDRTGDDEAEFLVTAHALEDREGQFVGVMLVARNVAYRTQVQSTLRYSRKLAALNRLLAGVAHEVKNPLNAMTIHLELLKQKLGAAMKASQAGSADGPVAVATNVDVSGGVRHLSIISQEIKRLDEVVQGFLRFSRPEELTLRPVPVRPLVDEVFGLVGAEASSRGVALRNECAGDLPAVQGDQTQLRQALINLALNACQAMPNGGMLAVRGRRTSGGLVELEVEDTGTGIPPEHLGRIFDLYFTTREGGSGLGLSMVFRTVQLHDGTIEAESTEGRGTIVRVRLPEADATAA